MKVVLVQPPIEDFYETTIRTYPLSLLYVGTRLKDVCEVLIYDLRTGVRPVPLKEHPFPELRPYYRSGTKTPFSLFSTYYRFGMTAGEIKERIGKEKPDVVCISSLFTTFVTEALEVARIVKEVNCDTVTIVGGIHPTLFPASILNVPHVDYVIRGEGETPLCKLISALEQRRLGDIDAIEGLCFRKDHGFHISSPHIEKDIDLIPDRTLLDARQYRIGGKRYTFFLTSRGCPMHCAFCGRPHVPYRKRSITAIEQEISDCLSMGIEAIDFEDDMLTLDTEFFRQVLDIFKGTGITLSAMNGIYSETLDRPMLEDMMVSGFRRLNFSLVDTSSSVLRKQARFSSKRFLRLLPWLESSPFFVEVHFIVGLPDQSVTNVLDTMLFLMGRRVLLGPSIFYLAPGSAIFSQLLGERWEQEIKRLRSSAMMPVSSNFSRDAIFTLMKLVRFINFVKQTLDREPGLKKLTDIDSSSHTQSAYERPILKGLLTEKRFICYDTPQRAFIEEPQDRTIIEAFFREAHGKTIKGFKTQNSLICDV